MLMAQALGTTPEFWLNLQTSYEVATARAGRKVKCLFTNSRKVARG
jgi:plasmid maintenance system antidote protein VapI